MTAPALEVAGMTKRFGGFTALHNVSIKIRPGTVHALLGENGAGKSTLVKCIMGFYQAEEGAVILDNQERTIDNPRQARDLGIGMVYQHFTMVPSMTVLENLVMARANVPVVIDWNAERKNVREFLQTMPFKVPLDIPTSSLAAGQKQKAEILKQLYLQCKFLILDEPTSVLTPEEADEVLGKIRAMASAGEITVLIITHKFREVTAFADAVSVLRRGRYAGGGTDLSIDQMATLMIGDHRPPPPATRALISGHQDRLAISGLTANDDYGAPALHGVDLEVRSGEIVGVAGVSGNGQTQLVQVLAGQRPATGGKVTLDGEEYHARRDEMQKHGLSLLPEEPLRNACAGRMSVADNMALRIFDLPPFARWGWWLSHGKIRAEAEELVARYQVKTSSLEAPISTLSGGNVQRAVLARELSRPVEVLIAANPVFGLDFAAVSAIHDQIVAARNRGTAVLLVSEDLDELLELSDRIAVMSEGRVVYQVPVGEADRTTIGRHMAGH